MWKKIVIGIVTGIFVLTVSAGSIYAYQKSNTDAYQGNAWNIFSIFERFKENKNFTADETGYVGAGGFGKGSLKDCNFCQCPDGDEEECDGSCAQNLCNNQDRNCYMYKNSSSSNCSNPDACGQQNQASNQERNCYSIMNRENYNQQENKNINGDTGNCGFNAKQGQKGKNK
jgi:hypothetical protein